jgi:hypothetical protein
MMLPYLLSAGTSIMGGSSGTSNPSMSARLQEGCTAAMTTKPAAPLRCPEQGVGLELAPGLEPGSAVYKTAALPIAPRQRVGEG